MTKSIKIRLVARSAALAVVGTLVVAQAAFADQSVRLVNHAGLTGSQVERFTNAAQKVINGNMYWQWDTPALRWTSSQRGSWTIAFYNRPGPVEAACGGTGAAGCHGVKNGKPYAIVDTRTADTGRIWSVAGTHELEEMWVDPRLRTRIRTSDGSGDRWIAEVSDPVEDYYHNVAGVQVSDYVYPDWYFNNDAQQDAMNRLYYAPNWWYLSCSGYATYLSWDGLHEMHGRGCNSMRSLHRAAMGKFVKPASISRMRSNWTHVNAHGDKVAIFPVAK